jgi:hypothetical protein
MVCVDRWRKKEFERRLATVTCPRKKTIGREQGDHLPAMSMYIECRSPVCCHDLAA